MLTITTTTYMTGFKKPGFFKKSPTHWVFWVLLGFWVFLDKPEKIGKIIQKLSNSKP